MHPHHHLRAILMINMVAHAGELVVQGFAVTARNAEVDGDEPYDHDYDELYRDTADSGGPPWDIGGPQPALARVLDDGVTGPKVLDVGCGTGDLAIALARRHGPVVAVGVRTELLAVSASVHASGHLSSPAHGGRSAGHGSVKACRTRAPMRSSMISIV